MLVLNAKYKASNITEKVHVIFSWLSNVFLTCSTSLSLHERGTLLKCANKQKRYTGVKVRNTRRLLLFMNKCLTGLSRKA